MLLEDMPIMLVAHIDTVFDPTKNLIYENDKLYKLKILSND